MTRGVGVLTGMAIRRAITTEGHTALLTRAQMNPFVSDFYTLFAFASFRVFDRLNRVEMRAASVRQHLILAILDGPQRRRSILRLQLRRRV